MNKKISALIITAALASAFCLSACGGDKKTPATTASSTTATTAIPSLNAPTQGTNPELETQDNSQTSDSENADGIPKEGDIYKGKKVGSVEKVPDCDDDKHGVYYINDEDGELIEAIKY